MSHKKLKDCSVLVTPTSFSKYNKKLAQDFEKMLGYVRYNKAGRPLKEGELIGLIGEFDGMIAGLDEINEKVIGSAKNLKVISRYGAGVDNVDLKAAEKAGICVTNTPRANATSVAELAIGLMIAVSRNIISGCSQTKAGLWPRLPGSSISGKTVGIVGMGNIGKEVAARLSCFKVKILACDIYFDKDFANKYSIEYIDIKSLLNKSDIVSLHVPVLDQTKQMINSKTLSEMKKGAILINTSRGALIDEDALFKSLNCGHLKAAALDAFSVEPPGKGNKLLSLEQVIVTPHMGAATDNCFKVLKGQKPEYTVVCS